MSVSDVAMELRKKLRERGRILQTIRSFFWTRDYVEIETPRLTTTPIPERHIPLFDTSFTGYDYATGAKRTRKLYLLPSPERYIKELLARGTGNVFEIAHAFRNGETTGPIHSPEFTMLEWYTVGVGSHDSLRLAIELLNELGVTQPVLQLSMREAFLMYAEIDLDACPTPASLAAACENKNLPARKDESWEDLFQRSFLTFVEPALPRDRAVFLTDYPAAIPTLAALGEDDRWADRWELYLGGIEVANCYREETNPDRIDSFLRDEYAATEERDTDSPPALLGYLTSENPLPSCSGVALGVDRLVMYLLGASSIAEVSSFSLSAMIADQDSNDKDKTIWPKAEQ